MPGMLDRIPGLPPPSPDVERFKTVLGRGVPDRVPLVELAIADEVLSALAGRPLAPLAASADRPGLLDWARDRVHLWYLLGYDYYRARVEIPFVINTRPADDAASETGVRQWIDEHQGVIASFDDVEGYPWPEAATIDFGPTEAALSALPEGMGLIGFSGGVLEWAGNLLGLENLMLLLYDQPELVRVVVDRVGQIIYEAFETFCTMDRVFAIWLGDDMGFRTATLIRPEQLRELILPWHRRYARLAHDRGRFFMLHSCGNIEAIMPDLIEQVGIDAKHSFEDAIMPVEEFKRRWGSRIAVLGGVDVDILSRRSPAEVAFRTRKILEACAPGGGYACGSGNSIPNYVPPGNFLAMLREVHAFNGR